MIFGAVAVEDAVGSVLAHSVATDAGRLRKGMMLDAPAIAQLQSAGLKEVIVARAEVGDIWEDEAAAELATAVAQTGSGLIATKAFTGRVNLLAPGPGVALLDADKLHAANAVHPMITVATVPPFQQMRQRGMVATIKIIAYAVPQTALREASALAQDAIGFAKPVLDTATLIISEIPGGAGDKGREAIEQRLTALNVALTDVVLVPHERDALAEAVQGTNSPLVLILTGSATSDPEDVAPSALRAAGGEVERFGMPVDPGNLLFLGQLGDQKVIGLPGCARAPALNGADWVLCRVICGQSVSAADIAGMGVGGLLKEIPSRPQPRTGRR